MKHLLWLITLPLTLAALVFAIANRHDATIDLWPLDLTREVPLYLILLLSLLVGFLLGGMVAWLSGGKVRARARRARMRIEFLELENTRLQKLSTESKGEERGPKVPSLPAA